MEYFCLLSITDAVRLVSSTAWINKLGYERMTEFLTMSKEKDFQAKGVGDM
jgi:hypothetical protein